MFAFETVSNEFMAHNQQNDLPKNQQTTVVVLVEYLQQNLLNMLYHENVAIMYISNISKKHRYKEFKFELF